MDFSSAFDDAISAPPQPARPPPTRRPLKAWTPPHPISLFSWKQYDLLNKTFINYVSCKVYVACSETYRRLGGESTWKIWMVLGCVICSLGFILWLVVHSPASVSLPLWFGAFHCFPKSGETCFCEILDDAKWFLDEFLNVLINFPSILERIKGFDGFSFPCVLQEFQSMPKGDWTEIGVKSTWPGVNSQWNRCGTEVRSKSDVSEFEVIEAQMNSKWDRSAMDVKSMWNRSQIDVISKWHPLIFWKILIPYSRF